MIDNLIKLAKSENLVVAPIDPGTLVFEERVKLLCFLCGKYGTRRTCPPNIPDLNWKLVVNEYNNGLIVCLSTEFDREITVKSRRDSTMALYSVLMKMESILHDAGFPLAVSFGGGSCKICGDCVVPCVHPSKSRIPIEAIGINVTKTLAKCEIDLCWPPKGKYMRVGLVLW